MTENSNTIEFVLAAMRANLGPDSAEMADAEQKIRAAYAETAEAPVARRYVTVRIPYEGPDILPARKRPLPYGL